METHNQYTCISIRKQCFIKYRNVHATRERENDTKIVDVTKLDKWHDGELKSLASCEMLSGDKKKTKKCVYEYIQQLVIISMNNLNLLAYFWHVINFSVLCVCVGCACTRPDFYANNDNNGDILSQNGCLVTKVRTVSEWSLDTKTTRRIGEKQFKGMMMQSVEV